MNNKGQSLVIFIILIPVIFLVFLFIYDYSLFKIKSNELEDITREILISAIKSNDNNKELIVKDLYNLNGYDNNNLVVNYNDYELQVEYTLKIDTLSNKIIKTKYKEIKINMIASKENNDIIIEE